MPSVLITGSEERTGEMARALTDAGCRCLVASDLAALAATASELGVERVDAYVQLPVTIEAAAQTAIGRVREFLAHGLVARFDAAELAVPAVRDGGVVILVAGNSPGPKGLNDDQQARYALLRVLGHSIVADNGGRRIRSIVLPSGSAADAVVDAVLGKPSTRQAAIADFVDRATEVDYADWRLELLSLATNES